MRRALAQRVRDHAVVTSARMRFRAKRVGPLARMIEAAYLQRGRADVVDIGGSTSYWQILSREYLASRGVRITIVNLPGTTAPANDELFDFVEGDGCELSGLGNASFDIAHSNSVIEHVGDWSKMVSFAAELRRIARSYFVQTPNFWFPIEPHTMTPFYHWLPPPVQVSLALRFNLGYRRRQPNIDGAVRQVERARLLDRRMFATLFPDGRVIDERLLFLTKSLIAIRENSEG